MDACSQQTTVRAAAVSFAVVRIALAAALGGFLLGFDATVISGAVPFIRDYFGLGGESGSLKLGWAVSALGWAAMAGNLSAGALSDRLGRRFVLRSTAVLFFCSALLAAVSTSYPAFILARILGGIGVGAAILTAPLYIAEIAPASRRGILVSMNQLMIVIGISVSFFSNTLLLPLGSECWRWMLGIQMIPALVFFLLLLGIPDSPRWLLARGCRQAALDVLRSVHGEAAAEQELQAIEAVPRATAGTSLWRALRVLFSKRMRFVMVFALGLAFFQQITGINAVFYYLPTIFAQAGGGLASAFRQSVLVGLVNVVMTLVAMRMVDRLGRKPLLIVGVSGMTVSLLTISWAFRAAALAPAGAPIEHATLILVAIITFVASFAISLGPVMWVMLAEIFPAEQRALAISVAGFWNSAISASVTLVFPLELSQWGPSGTFLAYGLLALAALLFIIILGPETKGRTLEEIEMLLT